MTEITLDYLLNFGAIGIFCAYLLLMEKLNRENWIKMTEKLEKIIENNTIVLTKVLSWLESIEKKENILEKKEEILEKKEEKIETDLKLLRKKQESMIK